MKLITAYIKPFLLDRTREALLIAGASGITVTEVKGFGRQLGHTELYRGAEYAVDFLPKIKIDVICKDTQKDVFIDAIVEVNKSDKIGSGKITVTHLDEVIRIRTCEKDEEAL
ncbi:P-II family nitrogen regulator [Fastidiosibacter lacustris]|uniref:P-II family nitrogen regulator n=1 Tax=Fastidiosibacter lacustris TaxID=2056695 RepID=UPI000E350866|nr:P-II family nitrogen regulator [Fastidiosibacter lacustris]